MDFVFDNPMGIELDPDAGEPHDVEALEALKEYLREHGWPKPTSPGPFLPLPEHDAIVYITGNSSKGDVIRFSNGFLIKNGERVIGIGPRPSGMEVFKAFDAMLGAPEMKPSVDWLRYRAKLWAWHDDQPSEGTTHELSKWMDQMPTPPATKKAM